AHGSTSVDPVTGEVTYTPDPNYFGQDTITYSMCDTGMPVACDTAQIVLTVNSVNDAPIATDDNPSTDEDTPVVIDVLANDTDVEGLDSTSVTILTPPTNGTITVDSINGEVQYIPNNHFFGQDTIVYVVCDTGMPVLCDTAQVIISVMETNTLFALGDINQTLMNMPVSGNVLFNDKDPQGHLLTVNMTPVVDPEHGTVVLNADGSYTYTPDDNYTGTDKFFYAVCDNGSPVVCDTAEVIINIIEIYAGTNNPPTGGADHFEMESGGVLISTLLPNDFDIDLDSIIINTTPVQAPSHGTLVINPDGTFEYTPNDEFIGSDTMFYEICDNGSPVLCTTVEVTVDIKEDNGENNTYATDDSGFGNMNTPITGNVLINDYDPENDDLILRVVAVVNPQHGTLALAANGAYIYTPDDGFSGNDYFVYALCDNGTPVACDTATAYLTVVNREGIPSAPVAVDDQATTLINTPVRIPVLLNDTIPETAVVTILNEPVHGMVEVDTNGVVTYIPNPDYCSTEQDSFSYEICTNTLCDTGSVFITINCEGVVIHEGFSPNGDGINDYFVIENVASFPHNSLKVYNRWGNQVFEKAPYDNSWSATWNDNKFVPDGTYFYIWKDGEGKTYSGYVVIHR
ncbi:MAG TPA: gliding motility-associated C-terminal domain-containing protein, partial [Saprospiraceae bacterium]|nr:gliding motility-associated C-terminal domain-containing protein [Saprospiraceae bacterium]